MKSQITINKPQKVNDYFPCLFSSASGETIILADSRTGERTFSGMIIHSENTKKNIIGTYSTSWTYQQFTRLPKGTNVVIGITQDDE